MNEETKQMERFLAEHLNVYIKDKHTQEECVGFIDGFKEALKQVKKLNIDDVSKCLKFVPSKNSEFYCAKCDELKEFHEEY